MHLRKRIYDILDPDHNGDPLSRAANWVIYGLIFLNVLAIVLESVTAISRQWMAVFNAFEVITVAVFSTEYLLRLWCCVESPRYSSPLLGRLRYVVSAMAIVDLLAILPFYLPFVHGDWVFLRSVRFFRLFRVLKLGRYSTAFHLLGRVVHAKRAELLVTVFIILVLTVLSAAGMYYAENDKQPEVFSDIPASMFWAIAALTNVGHADPVTPLGKCLASIIFILGLGMFALPTGILGAAFVEECTLNPARLASGVTSISTPSSMACRRVYLKMTTPCGVPSSISEGVKPTARSASSMSISIGCPCLLGLLVFMGNS